MESFLYFRKLTDKDKEEGVAPPGTEEVQTSLVDCAVIAKGNASLIPVFKSSTDNGNRGGVTESKTTSSKSVASNEGEKGTNKETGLLNIYWRCILTGSIK